MTQQELLSNSVERIATHAALAAKTLPELDTQTLNRAPAPGRWSVAQVLEHILKTLVLYYAKLDPVVEAAQPGTAHQQAVYKMGLIGGFIVRLTENPNARFPKFKLIQPQAADAPTPIPATIVDDYLAAVHDFEARLVAYRRYDLRRTRFANPFFALHKMQLGDAILEHVVHFERHWQQIERTLVKTHTN